MGSSLRIIPLQTGSWGSSVLLLRIEEGEGSQGQAKDVRVQGRPHDDGEKDAAPVPGHH